MKKKRVYLIIALVVTFLYLVSRIMGLGWVEHLELVTLDFRMNLRGEIEHSDTVKIVAIDNKSLAHLYNEENNPWPWQRDVYARIIDKLDAAGAKTIVMDISFDHYNYNDPAGDRQFAESMFASSSVIIGAYLINNRADYDQLPESYQHKISSKMEHLNYRYQLLNPSDYFIPKTFSTYLYVPPEDLFVNTAWAYSTYEIGLPDANGLYHSIPLVIREEHTSQQQEGASVFLPNINILGLASYYDLNPGDYAFDIKNNQIILADKANIPVDANGYFTINYYGSRSFSETSVVDILEKEVAELKNTFQDKIVLIGYTAESKGLVDLRPTPFNKNEAGVQLHATTMQNIIDEDYLERVPLWANLLMIFTVFLLAAYLSSLNNLKLSIISNLAFILLFNIFNYLLFLENIWLELFYPNLILVAFLIYSTILKVYLENKKRIKTKDFFSRYVPESVVNEILANPDKINLGGEEMEVTILFIDIVGFTSISEKLKPEELVRLLNDFFTEMTKIIKNKHRGTLDKFIGDSILAIFGAPFCKEDDAIRAVNAALDIKTKALELEKKWQERGEKVTFEIGVGISTGLAVVGNVGSPDRMNYTCIGDVVNIGARLESATHNNQLSILINEATYEKVKYNFHCQKISDLSVKGKAKNLTAYNIISKT